MHVMDKGGVPHTRYVRGTNYNFISVFPDRLPGRAIVISGALTALCMLLFHADMCAQVSVQQPRDPEVWLLLLHVNVISRKHGHSMHLQLPRINTLISHGFPHLRLSLFMRESSKRLGVPAYLMYHAVNIDAACMRCGWHCAVLCASHGLFVL